jgi:hypothetical protein
MLIWTSAGPSDVFRKAQIYHVGRFVRICSLQPAAVGRCAASLVFH